MAEVVVGIDFGYTYSGFAFAFIDNPHEIIYGNIIEGNIHGKIQTEIILDDNNNIISFGERCKEYIINNGLIKGNYHYFKEIKRNLSEKKEKIQAYNSLKICPLELIIQKIFEKLKDLAINQIKICYPYIQNEIKYVVSIPAYWKDFQKNIIMKACTLKYSFI